MRCKKLHGIFRAGGNVYDLGKHILQLPADIFPDFNTADVKKFNVQKDYVIIISSSQRFIKSLPGKEYAAIYRTGFFFSIALSKSANFLANNFFVITNRNMKQKLYLLTYKFQQKTFNSQHPPTFQKRNAL